MWCLETDGEEETRWESALETCRGFRNIKNTLPRASEEPSMFFSRNRLKKTKNKWMKRAQKILTTCR